MTANSIRRARRMRGSYSCDVQQQMASVSNIFGSCCCWYSQATLVASSSCKSRPPPLPCLLCSQQVLIRSKLDLMETMISSILWGVAGESPATCSCEQSMALMKSTWHLDAGAIGLNASLFHRSLITSNTVGGLSIKCHASVSKFWQATTWKHSKQLIMLFSTYLISELCESNSWCNLVLALVDVVGSNPAKKLKPINSWTYCRVLSSSR